MSVEGIHTRSRSLPSVSRLHPQKAFIALISFMLSVSSFLYIWPEELDHEFPYEAVVSTELPTEAWYNTSPYEESNLETLGPSIPPILSGLVAKRAEVNG